jgi:PBP1b-binding outer membrane lipoprotein LpoB
MAEKKSAAKPATSKQPGKQAAPLRDPQTLTINGKLGETMPQSKARAATKASLNASMVVNAFQGNIMGKDVDISELVTTMQTKFKEVNDGDLSKLEAMLVGQATALQTMFTSLAMRAANQEYLKQYGLYMTLALKAQAQSRATISALVDLKYPKQAATFVKQANISSGHQQVNNQSAPELSAQAHAHAEDFQTTPNKLLEANHGQRLDIGAQAQTGRTNQRVEAVGAIHRA